MSCIVLSNSVFYFLLLVVGLSALGGETHQGWTKTQWAYDVRTTSVAPTWGITCVEGLSELYYVTRLLQFGHADTGGQVAVACFVRPMRFVRPCFYPRGLRHTYGAPRSVDDGQELKFGLTLT